jgi:hypothetical protein
METDLTKAQHYRDLADHMRELAGQEVNHQIRDTMVELAEKYDELCRQIIDRVKRFS